MTLFDDFEQIKEIIGAANTSNSLETLTPYIDSSIETYLLPFFGSELIETIDNYLNGGLFLGEGEGDEEEEIALNKVVRYFRQAAAHLAFLQLSQDGGIQVDDSGFHRIDNTETKNAYQWQMLAFQRAREAQGWVSIRNLYTYLESKINLPIFDNYKNSNSRKENRSYIISTDTDFNKYLNIGGFETWWHIRNYMMQVQIDTLAPLITQEVYDSILSYISDGYGTIDNTLLSLCKRVVASGSITAAAPFLPFKVHNSGLLITEFVSTQGNSHQETQAIERAQKLLIAAANIFERAKSDLEQYMTSKASPELYPTYYEKVVQKRIEEQKTREDIQEHNSTSKIVRL